MLTENRVLHSLGVARKCYTLSKELKMPEKFCRKMFFLGYIHDIGYEFEDSEGHARISADILHSLGCNNYDTLQAIKYHSENDKTDNLEWKILTEADMTIDSKGNEVTIEERLNDIKERYGETSKQYKTALKVIKETEKVRKI